MQHQAVEHKTRQPQYQAHPIHFPRSRLAFQHKIIRDLHCNHRRKHRADKIQKPFKAAHIKHQRQQRAQQRNRRCHRHFTKTAADAVKAHPSRIRIQKRGAHRGQHHHQNSGRAQPGILQHRRDFALAGKQRRRQPDGIHPRAGTEISQCSRKRGRPCLGCAAGVVRHQRQPRQRHHRRQLHRQPETHRFRICLPGSRRLARGYLDTQPQR